jgi:hypothetical protein
LGGLHHEYRIEKIGRLQLENSVGLRSLNRAAFLRMTVQPANLCELPSNPRIEEKILAAFLQRQDRHLLGDAQFTFFPMMWLRASLILAGQHVYCGI